MLHCAQPLQAHHGSLPSSALSPSLTAAARSAPQEQLTTSCSHICCQQAAQVGLALWQAAQAQPVLLPDGHRLQPCCHKEPVCGLSLTCASAALSKQLCADNTSKAHAHLAACRCCARSSPALLAAGRCLGQAAARLPAGSRRARARDARAARPDCPGCCTPPGRQRWEEQLPVLPAPASTSKLTGCSVRL